MIGDGHNLRHPPLHDQLSWFIRLRWGAGSAVILVAVGDWEWLGWFAHPVWMIAAGAAILAYNGVLRAIVRPRPEVPTRRAALVTLAWIQVVADLACLTLLTLWTGGGRSPLLGFYVFHMVITSLLLPDAMAYGAAGLSALMLAGGLWTTRQWPQTHLDTLALLGWVVTLGTIVYLTSNITRSLRRHRLRAARQSRRIRSMSDKLREQRRAMIQQDKMAAMGQLAAGVAHEIANPLACMDSLLQLVQRNPKRMRAETAEKLREQITRINQIVRQLTDFAHPGEARREEATIHELVGRALQMVRFDRRIRDVKMHTDRQESAASATVTVQPHAIEQVLVNIILNALDAMADEPHPVLAIRSWRQDNECLVEVCDNGYGIKPENIDHLFDPFFTTKPVGKGTGLGLAIAYRLIRSHGGNIEVRSNGKGATFTVSLPVTSGVP